MAFSIAWGGGSLPPPADVQAALRAARGRPVRWVVVQGAGLGLSTLGWREKLMLSWLAPRGIVTASVGSLFALRLEEAGVPGAGMLKGLVFLTILLTVGLQGATAPWLARRLGLNACPLPELATSGSGASPAAPVGGEPR